MSRSERFARARTLEPAQAEQLLKDLSDTALRDLAGDKVFARGKAYANSGAVQDLDELPPTPDHLLGVQAMVYGSEAYSTEIWWLPDDDLDGDCDCPHAQDGFFCKHQVALARIWRGLLSAAGHGSGSDIASPPHAVKAVQAAARRAQTRADRSEALRQFVFAQKAEDLAAVLWRMADDPGLMAQLKTWHVQVATQGQLSMADAQAVRELVHDLLKSPKSYLGPRDCAAYAFQAAQIFPIIESVLAHSPSQARALCEDALKCLYKVGGKADDSWNGEFSDLVERTTALLKLGLQAEPPPAAWLKTWLSLAEKDPWGLLPQAGLIAAAGPAVQAAYSARVARDWQDWLKAHPEPEGPWDPERHKRRSAYLADLLEQGDDGAALEAMRSTARLSGEWADLLQWCEQRQRWREVLELAQKAYKLHPKDWRIEDTLLRCYERDGWDEEALAIWRQRLRAHPGVENYQSVLRAAQRAGRDRAAYRDELMAWAAASEKRVLRSGFGSHAKTETVTDVSVRASWWLDGENDSAQALALVQQPGVRCQESVLRRLALSLPPDQNATAVTFLQALFYENMERAKTPYQSELALVREVLQRMTAEQGTQWVAELLSQFKVKRNFIKELPIP